MALWSARHKSSTDSKSLWNFTLSPGWSEDEIKVLRLAIMRHGMGRWSEVQRYIPGKTTAQIYLQTQRMVGQQSLAEFGDIRLDPLAVNAANAALQGPGVKRKGGVIVNTGDNMTAEVLRARRAANIEKYGIAEADAAKVEVPTLQAGGGGGGGGGEPLSLSAKLVLLELLHERKRQVCTRLDDVAPGAKRRRPAAAKGAAAP